MLLDTEEREEARRAFRPLRYEVLIKRQWILVDSVRFEFQQPTGEAWLRWRDAEESGLAESGTWRVANQGTTK